MKIEIGAQRPETFKTYWDGQYEIFSYFEYACGIPSVLFAITTTKENSTPNVNFNAWSSFTGDGDGFFAIMGGLYQHTHTYQNIIRTGEFVINFIGKEYYEACMATIEHNDEDVNEFEVAGFTVEPAKTLSCPRIGEAFLSLECRLERQMDLSGSGKTALVIGKVGHIAMKKEFATGLEAGNPGAKYGDNGFMFNIHAPKNLLTGDGETSGLAVLKVIKTDV
ncbi:MAG: flavin reductase family protein [Acetanaerobacterium sp.]